MPPGNEQQREWLRRVLGVDLTVATGTVGSTKGSNVALEIWRTSRSKAIASLKALESAVRKSDHPGGDNAIISLRAIAANLTEAPKTLQQVHELHSYIRGDDVVEAAETPNVFGVEVSLRDALLPVLDSLAKELAAEEGYR